MRVVAVLCLLAGCDGIWDLERIAGPDGRAVDSLPVDVVVAADLIAWFPMDSVESGTVTELVTGGNGMCTGGSCPIATLGRVDGALLFDGSAQLVTATPSAALNTKASFTVAVWARIDASVAEGTECVVSKRYGTSTSNSWQLCSFFDNWRFVTVNTMVSGPAVQVGVWQHFALTWDDQSTELVLHVDGEVSGAPVFEDIPFDDGQLVIGADVDQNANSLFPGAIDDVRIYNRALDATEIKKLAVRD